MVVENRFSSLFRYTYIREAATININVYYDTHFSDSYVFLVINKKYTIGYYKILFFYQLFLFFFFLEDRIFFP